MTKRVKIYEIHKFNNFIFDTIYFLLMSPLKIMEIHKKDPINIINIHNFTYFLIIPFIIRKFFRIPILIKLPIDFTSFIRDTYMQKENKFRIRIMNYSWSKFFTKILIRKTDFIRTINEKMFNDLVNLKYPEKNILRIPNGINTKEFLGIKKLTHDNVHFGYVGRLIEFKNLRLLLRTFKLYLSKYPLDKLYIYGFGPEEIWISQYIMKNNLENNVILYGFEKDKAKIYSKIDVLIDTALAQGISNSILEAMCTNTFVIASDVYGNTDLIKEKSTGLLFNPYNKYDLLKKLLFYKENPIICQKIIINAKNEIINNFDINIITNKIYNFLKSRLL